MRGKSVTRVPHPDCRLVAATTAPDDAHTGACAPTPPHRANDLGLPWDLLQAIDAEASSRARDRGLTQMIPSRSWAHVISSDLRAAELS